MSTEQRLLAKIISYEEMLSPYVDTPCWICSLYRGAREAYRIWVGEIPTGLWVLHFCDQPKCINPEHLWLVTYADNVQDRCEKGRSATGTNNGQHTHPKKRARGNRHWTRLYPEKVLRGENHGLVKNPLAAATGDRNGSRLYPERLKRGEEVNTAVLSTAEVLFIRYWCDKGYSQKELAKIFRVNPPAISKIHRRQTWRHV